MKTYTQQDFEALVRDENGYLHCLARDWSSVEVEGVDKIVFAQFARARYGESVERLEVLYANDT